MIKGVRIDANTNGKKDSNKIMEESSYLVCHAVRSTFSPSLFLTSAHSGSSHSLSSQTEIPGYCLLPLDACTNVESMSMKTIRSAVPR